MTITKSEAIVMLAISSGNSDGEFSFEEIEKVITKTPALRRAMSEAETTDWLSKYRTKELNTKSALKAVSHLTMDERTEVLAICWEIMLADGEIIDAEKQLIESWCKETGVKMEDVIEKQKQITE